MPAIYLQLVVVMTYILSFVASFVASSNTVMLNSCMFLNNSNTTNGLVTNLIEDLTVPSLIVMIITFFLAGVCSLALLSSQCYQSSNALFYFNLTVTDAIMSFSGISIIILPNSEDQKIAPIFYALRYVSFLQFLFRVKFLLHV